MKLDIIKQIASELGLRYGQVESTVALLDAENTIPFIARYRKEATGELDENQIRDIDERVQYLRNLEARKEEVFRLIDEQEKMTPEIAAAISGATKLQALEDIYRPFRPKRRTRATIAKEKGLEPLAEIIFAQELGKGDVETVALPFVNPELKVETVQDAIAGALDIIAEKIADMPEVHRFVRENTYREGFVVTKLTKDGESKEKASQYQMYFAYREPIAKIPSHRILAVNRGEKEGILKVELEANQDKILVGIRNKVITNTESIFYKNLIDTITDCYTRLVAPSVEREIRTMLTEMAEEQAIKVFGKNLRNLLLQPPVRGKVVLALDPGYRTGCKVAVVNETGKLLATGTIYPHPPQGKIGEAKLVLKELIQTHGVNIISIGNGTASRETEQMVSELLKEFDNNASYIIVSEAGASVYSASKVAQEEFPELDVSIRGAVSIGRRLQDPLAELVKIDPKSIGVGQYQHDVSQKRLAETLGGVVESTVNYVGVDLNTASGSLLQYVAGVSATVAKNIVKYRDENGKFVARAGLRKVPRLGDQTFQQCAGFLRIADGKNILDNTSVHPESYALAEKIVKKLGYAVEDILDKERFRELQGVLTTADAEKLAQELEAGVPTVRDILSSLAKPGRDPRDELPKPLLRKDVLSITDLHPEMVLEGTVRNVVDFGAFIDIGIKEGGLVHISEITDRYIKHPGEVLSVGDIVQVKVINIDLARKRVGLSMKI